jgi:uridylate kinase
MKIAIKIGHSLFKHPINTSDIKDVANAIVKLHEDGHAIVVVVGGGSIARDYIDSARKLGSSWSEADLMGIQVSRLNARLMSAAIGDRALLSPMKDLEEISLPLQIGKIAITGGLTPGHSTDAVAALASEVIKAELFIKTMDVGGIYDKDPKKFTDAKILKRVKYDELRKIVLSSYSPEAGEYSPLDLVALDVLGRSKIPTIFTGSNPKELVAAVAGEDVGTRLVYE